MLGYSLWLSVAVFLQIRRLETLPFTSEWDSVAVDAPDGAEFLFLLLGDSPYWMIPMMDRPPAAARVLARGDLRDGGVVQLKIDGHLYQPAGPVARVDDEMLAVVRADLAAGLHDDREAPPQG